jgi:hypothetical protein
MGHMGHAEVNAARGAEHFLFDIFVGERGGGD